MTDDERAQQDLERPEEIRGEDGQRKDGRPTGPKDEETGLRPGAPAESQPTVAPEETGGTPTTEHAPGGDL